MQVGAAAKPCRQDILIIYERSEFIWKKKTFIHSTSLKSQAHHLSYTLKTIMQSIPPKVQYVVCVQIRGVHISASASAVLGAVLVHVVCWKEAHLATEAVKKDTLGRTPRHMPCILIVLPSIFLCVAVSGSLTRP